MLRMVLVLILVATTANAQQRRPSHCIAVAEAVPGLEFIQRASWSNTVPDFSVRISYIDHSMFLIQTPGGLSVATDYTGYTGPAPFLPSWLILCAITLASLVLAPLGAAAALRLNLQ